MLKQNPAFFQINLGFLIFVIVSGRLLKPAVQGNTKQMRTNGNKY